MKWLELFSVASATLVSAVTVVVLYSLGVRLTAIAGDTRTSPAGVAATCLTWDSPQPVPPVAGARAGSTR